ncbi:MAG: hypothetical protein IJU92_02960 [Spirochaetaceae bacterium]|nr:hypothetical protein [Spirochaetaceae bacterium]
MDTTNTESFFTSLSWRMGKENDLSDITYSLCMANNEFRKFFLKFCFDEGIDTESLTREYSCGDSRPDFYFVSTHGNEYLIEIKRWDRNDHFEQYENTFPNAKRAFISNYAVPPRDNCKVKTWKGFFDELSASPLKNDTIILGYLAYLKNLAQIKEFEIMKLGNYRALPILLDNLGEILIQELGYTYYDHRGKDQYYYGSYICRQEPKVLFWIGIALCTNEVFIGFNPTWYGGYSETIKLALQNLKPEYETEYFKFEVNPDKDYFGMIGTHLFTMKKIDILHDDSKTKDEQRAALREFIVEVFKAIGIES